MPSSKRSRTSFWVAARCARAMRSASAARPAAISSAMRRWVETALAASRGDGYSPRWVMASAQVCSCADQRATRLPTTWRTVMFVVNATS